VLAEVQVNAPTVVHREDANTFGAAVPLQEGLELWPALRKEVSEVAAKSEAVNDRVEALSMPQSVDVGIRHTMLRAGLDFVW